MSIDATLAIIDMDLDYIYNRLEERGLLDTTTRNTNYQNIDPAILSACDRCYKDFHVLYRSNYRANPVANYTKRFLYALKMIENYTGTKPLAAKKMESMLNTYPQAVAVKRAANAGWGSSEKKKTKLDNDESMEGITTQATSLDSLTSVDSVVSECLSCEMEE